MPAVVRSQGGALSSGESDYVLVIGDVVELNVFREPDLTTQATIARDGTVQLPLIREVTLAGYTIRDARELSALGIGVAAICSNDATTHPADSFANMARMAAERGFPFPYLHDEDQSVARDWGAQCTPDFFGLNAAGELQYRGRLDASGRTPGPPDARRDLYEAMRMIAETGQGPREQVASMGCSIKWRRG